MNNLGNGGLILVGIALVILGVLIQSDILEWLLDIAGFVLIASGIVVGVVGLVKMFTGSKDGAGGY